MVKYCEKHGVSETARKIQGQPPNRIQMGKTL